MMTFNQLKDLFNNIADAHDMIKDFAFGEVWEIEQKMNKEAEYHMMYVAPIQSATLEQVKERTFMIFIFDVPKKDGSNDVPVWSDTEQILDDVIKILRKESPNYEVVGDPVLFPFKEEHSDWVSGWRAEVVVRTDLNSNYCDVPSREFISPSSADYRTVEIVDQDGNVLTTVQAGPNAKYVVTVFSGVRDTLTANVTTILDNIL